MTSDPERIIARVVAHLAGREGVRAIALVGSRGSGDPARIDEFSDADFLVCCTEEERARLVAGDWVRAVEPPLLVFPPVMEDEVRILFEGLFACEIHILTVEQAEALSGPCRLGSHLAQGMKILHDPDGLLARLGARVRPEPEEERDLATASRVFWYNVAYCANLIARGDLFRAGHMANWYLQLFLLSLLRPIEGPDATKRLARKLRADQYEALAATVSPLTREGMAAGLDRCMRTYWRFQAEAAPEMDPALLAAFRRIEERVRARLGGEGSGAPRRW